MNKKASFIEKIVDFLLGAIVSLLLAYFLLLLLFPSFNKPQEGAKAFFNSIESEINSLELGDSGEVSQWGGFIGFQDYFVVYFHNKPFESFGRNQFISFDLNFLRQLCVCYRDKGQNFCESCMPLNLPVNYQGREVIINPSGSWSSSHDKFKISLEEVNGQKQYLFEEF
jgi:hypothetical protein